MKLDLKIFFIALLVGTLMYSCSSSENDLNIDNKLEIENLPTPLEYISQYDNTTDEGSQISLNLDVFNTKEIAIPRTNCPAADHATEQLIWAFGPCNQGLYCSYLAEFWYIHSIIANLECGTSNPCLNCATAIGFANDDIEYLESVNLHPFYIDHLWQQLALLEDTCAAEGC